MKNILIISATSNTNFKLSNDLKTILETFDGINAKIISLEDYNIPLYTTKIKNIENFKSEIKEITKYFVESDGFIICGPEYNGSIAPILTNLIAWISTTTDYWRDAFINKVSLLATSSGGFGNKFLLAMRIQLEHLGTLVHPRTISVTSSNPLNKNSSSKILKHYIDLL